MMGREQTRLQKINEIYKDMLKDSNTTSPPRSRNMSRLNSPSKKSRVVIVSNQNSPESTLTKFPPINNTPSQRVRASMGPASTPRSQHRLSESQGYNPKIANLKAKPSKFMKKG